MTGAEDDETARDLDRGRFGHSNPVREGGRRASLDGDSRIASSGTRAYSDQPGCDTVA